MKKQLFLIIICIVFLASCSLNYTYVYLTHLDNSKDKTLTYQDSIMKFTFSPTPNGIFFEIQNLSSENIFLLWDGTYISDPTGNSSKALNKDLLETKDKIVSKENNESIIPKKGTFKRFTTSAKNISVVQKIDVSNYYISKNYSMQNANYAETFLYSPYWPPASRVAYDGSKKDYRIQHGKEMLRMSDFVKNNNNLGIGFTFRKGEKKLDYDFKIKIDRIVVKLKDVSGVDTLRVFN